MADYILPDVLKKGLSLVFCGTAVGNRSANIRAYYAGRGNKFWKVLHEVGLTPFELSPYEFEKLSNYGIGLTDLAKHAYGNDFNLINNDFDIKSFQNKVIMYSPKILAFNGKKAAKIFLGTKEVTYGLYKEKKIGDTVIHILPSTSGAANKSWDITFWSDIAAMVKSYQ